MVVQGHNHPKPHSLWEAVVHLVACKMHLDVAHPTKAKLSTMVNRAASKVLLMT